MCSHGNTVKINDVRVCLKCGMTITNNGKIIFDKKIAGYRPARKVRK